MATQSKPSNPLPPCPDSPNCNRLSVTLKASSEDIKQRLQTVFEQDAHEWKQNGNGRIEFHAVYRIPVFGWKDDVDVIIEEDSESGCTVFLRSASRVGYSDLGVNKRRINRIIQKIKPS